MTRAFKLAIGMTLLGPVVMAQPGPGRAPGPVPEAQAPGTDADIGIRQRPSLSPQEMIAQSKSYRERMKQSETHISGLVESARKQKDIIRLNCLNDKLVQVRGNSTIADQAMQALQEAALRKDEGGGLYEFTRITIVHQKIQVLVAEAEACAGEDLRYVGATRVDVEIDGIPPDDFTQPGPPRSDLDRPPAASPYE